MARSLPSGAPTLLVASSLAGIVVGLVIVGLARSDRMRECPAVIGGETGAAAQLRYVDVSARQVTFTFGASAAPGPFGIPGFRIEPLDGQAPPVPPELDTGTSEVAVSFDGASGFNPDLSPSYHGPSVVVPLRAGIVREALVTLDTERHMSWNVVLQRSSCATVTTNAYVWGKSPRVQVTLTFGQRSWVTAEHPPGYVGSPILTPVLVTGLGFAPASELRVRIAGIEVQTAMTDDAGRVEVSFAVPRLPPGVYQLEVTDAVGHRAGSLLVVTDER